MSRDKQAKMGWNDADFLRDRVTELERQVADRETSVELQASGERALLEALQETRARLEQVEKENEEFANMFVEIQEQNEALTNLYVASQRLHATFELEKVEEIITDILVEMVGAEEFGLLLLDESKRELRVLTGQGIHERLPKDSLPMGEGIIGDVAATGESFYFVPKSETEMKAHLPLATLAMKLNGTTVGVVVIYKLLSHKKVFSPIDYQILDLVAAHAASALVSARLHGTMDRKLKTIERFMQLMKSR